MEFVGQAFACRPPDLWQPIPQPNQAQSDKFRHFLQISWRRGPVGNRRHSQRQLSPATRAQYLRTHESDTEGWASAPEPHESRKNDRLHQRGWQI